MILSPRWGLYCAAGNDSGERSGMSPPTPRFLYRQADACRSPILSLMTAWSIKHSFRIFPGRCPGLSHGVPLARNTWRPVLIVPPCSGLLSPSCRNKTRINQ